jgi:hypothetical protein
MPIAYPLAIQIQHIPLLAAPFPHFKTTSYSIILTSKYTARSNECYCLEGKKYFFLLKSSWLVL